MEDPRTKKVQESGAPTEKEMRESTAPSPATTDELARYIDTLVDRPHDYGTCVFAMSLAATAAFNYVASKLGVTGFQASCADMDILRRTRGMKHGFSILNAHDVLYPQYDLVGRTFDWVEKMRQELAPEAAKLLATATPGVAPAVLAHWKGIVALAPKEAIDRLPGATDSSIDWLIGEPKEP